MSVAILLSCPTEGSVCHARKRVRWSCLCVLPDNLQSICKTPKAGQNIKIMINKENANDFEMAFNDFEMDFNEFEYVIKWDVKVDPQFFCEILYRMGN